MSKVDHVIECAVGIGRLADDMIGWIDDSATWPEPGRTEELPRLIRLGTNAAELCQSARTGLSEVEHQMPLPTFVFFDTRMQQRHEAIGEKIRQLQTEADRRGGMHG